MMRKILNCTKKNNVLDVNTVQRISSTSSIVLQINFRVCSTNTNAHTPPKTENQPNVITPDEFNTLRMHRMGDYLYGSDFQPMLEDYVTKRSSGAIPDRDLRIEHVLAKRELRAFHHVGIAVIQRYWLAYGILGGLWVYYYLPPSTELAPLKPSEVKSDKSTDSATCREIVFNSTTEEEALLRFQGILAIQCGLAMACVYYPLFAMITGLDFGMLMWSRFAVSSPNSSILETSASVSSIHPPHVPSITNFKNALFGTHHPVFLSGDEVSKKKTTDISTDIEGTKQNLETTDANESKTSVPSAGSDIIKPEDDKSEAELENKAATTYNKFMHGKYNRNIHEEVISVAFPLFVGSFLMTRFVLSFVRAHMAKKLPSHVKNIV